MWRAVRSRALGMRPPQCVVVVLNYLVEKQALNSHWQMPRIRIGYGRHSEKERAWDHRRREQLIEEGAARRHLVQLPTRQQDGIAEICGMSRRSAIRAGRWLVARKLVYLFHEHGLHPIGHKFEGIGRGGCIAGGVGAATEWRAGAAPGPESEPEPEPEPKPAPGRRPLREIDAEARAGRPPRALMARGP
jgi:hypothetical protein